MSTLDTQATTVSLVARRLQVRRSSRTVLRDVSLALHSGQRVALVGPNGSGKSTLLKACAGILPLASGSILVDGIPIGTLHRRELARLIALMPQSADMHFPLSCLETVLLGRSPHKRGLGLADARDFELAERSMQQLDVWELAQRPITAVSGGELQRLMFARVLVQQCPIVLLDEPTSAQDPPGILRMQQVLQRLSGQRVATLVAVHDLNVALRFFHRVIVLARGRVIDDGSPDEILERDALEKAFGVRLRRLDDEGTHFVIPELR